MRIRIKEAIEIVSRLVVQKYGLVCNINYWKMNINLSLF